MARCKTDEKAKKNLSANSAKLKTPKVDMRLGRVIDADSAVGYLSTISGFRMKKEVVEITDIEDDRCTAVVTCRNMSQAREFVSAINTTTEETSLTASLHGVLEPRQEVEKTWKKLCDMVSVVVQQLSPAFESC